MAIKMKGTSCPTHGCLHELVVCENNYAKVKGQAREQVRLDHYDVALLTISDFTIFCYSSSDQRMGTLLKR